MKTLKYILLVLIVFPVLGLQSCLKEKLVDTPTPAALTSEEDINAVVTGAYLQLNDFESFKYQGMLMLFMCADDIYGAAGTDFLIYGNHTYTPLQTYYFWDKLYATINNANNIIETLDRLNLSPAFEKRAYGEAYFLRAFSYYYLVRLYGGVPLRLQTTNINSDLNLPRNTVDEVYTQIFADFKKASERLPLASGLATEELGRATKGAAQAILSQAFLTYGDHLSLAGQAANTQFQSSELYADSVLNSAQYSLIPDYGNLFNVSLEAGAYKEVIFGIRFNVDFTTRATYSQGSEFAWRFGAPNTFFVCGLAQTGAGAGNARINPWVANFYRTGDYAVTVGTTTTVDYRNDKAFNTLGYNATTNKYYAVFPTIPTSTQLNINVPILGKYIDPSGKDERNNGNDFFVIRLAEVDLIKAEAENELNGPTTAALNAFNAVRARARSADGNARTVPANIVAGLTKDQFRQKIFDERGLELLGEGQRWFDLVRMRSPNSATQTMYEYQFAKLKSAPYTTVFPAYNATTKAWAPLNGINSATLTNVQVPKFLLFPIPSSELLNNNKFGSQNPGW